ncbi:MAG: ABC transporter ATP-binding protein [Candidatus Eremiobacteraeota bacterium]|nr:ABC transporter ATP-binding protein [Candidatus Eremiobacteraeota bacterium]MBC5803515.1 ABC transporter ATP-binding protein [Candidatus Eremiobacteraeota bacterium]MBC5821801.1 ABC transporter ATP-binding protein [Candidatus Eremiobacteraeota bacterium]
MTQSRTLMEHSPVAARLVHASKRYGDHVAVDALDLTLHAGETLALLGPNGAGKTTAIRLLLGLARPTGGSAEIFGRDPRERRTRERVGAMLQVSNVPATLTVAEHLALFASYYPRPFPLRDVIELACLQSLTKRRFEALSGGERQRLFFALAICGNPDVLFLDEPSAGLDVETRETLWTGVRELVARGKSVLLTTHYLHEADALAHRIVLLSAGAVLAEGTPAELKALATDGNGAPATLERAYLSLMKAVA